MYEIKANLFKALAHPVRVRILELLVSSPDQQVTVASLLEDTGLEASHLSQHLRVLKRHLVVTSVREANTVTYSLAHPKVTELLAIARVFLIDSLAGSKQQLAAAEQLPALGVPVADAKVPHA